MEEQQQQQQQQQAPAQQQFLLPGSSDRDPVKDAQDVVEELSKDGTIDAARRKVMEALRHNDAFRGAVQQVLADGGYLQPGRTYSREARLRVAQDFLKGPALSSDSAEKQLVTKALEIIWQLLTDASDPAGLVAENQAAAQQALIKLLVRDELQRERVLRQLLGEEQRAQQAALAGAPPSAAVPALPQ